MLNHIIVVCSEGSIPVEETGTGSDMTWIMFLRRGAEEVSVRLTSFQGLSLSTSTISVLHRANDKFR